MRLLNPHPTAPPPHRHGYRSISVPSRRATLKSKCSVGSGLTVSISMACEDSPKRRSHEVRRILALRDRFQASWRRGQCSAPPAQPPKTTEKSGRSRVGRTLSRGQVAEGRKLRSNLLHARALQTCSPWHLPAVCLSRNASGRIGMSRCLWRRLRSAPANGIPQQAQAV